MPYVYRKVSNLEEQPKVGSHECVALIREYTNAPPSSTWRQGAAVLDNMSIEKGTAIATFVKGRYPNARTGNHAAFFLRFDPQGFWVMDQWRNNKSKNHIFAPHQSIPYTVGKRQRSSVLHHRMRSSHEKRPANVSHDCFTHR